MKDTKIDPIFEKFSLWSENENTLWLGSSLKLLRNIEKYQFPAKLNKERRNQVVSLCSKGLEDIPEIGKLQILRAEEMSPIEKDFLVEHFLSSQTFQQSSEGEAFAVEEKGEFLAAINIRNHLQLELHDTKGELEQTMNRLVKIETALAKKLTISFSQKYGFLTSDASECGTGMLANAYLQLSALIHTAAIEQMLDKYLEDTVHITGLQGNPTEIIGDILVVHNNFTLGVTEENIITSLRNFITKMLLEEASARNTIRSSDNPSLKDKVSRAFGILIHSYQIDAVEALNAISLLKLGADLGWLKGMDVKGFNQLFFTCRRAHLIHHFKESISPEEILHKRAEFIHRKLKDVELTI